ncbi:acetyltransferase [Paenibacillus konkukensis]|uniref:Acetyltransferase n=1 Tax=Paenibacillus konkukensis TaxID=2020716 RepID=A0ABY4RKE4_9BACL|nr:GNAT family N-acetyltransferase [Paenibacillus konkukensis]UQZ82048.1 acetyltransferase [Paenibacillus konkukensis]
MFIRKAELSDAAHLSALSEQLDYTVTPEDMAARLGKIFNEADHAVFVMETENSVAGWVHIHGRHLLESPAFAEIGGLVVDSAHRRKGIGEKLMRQCEQWAREKGYAAVRLRSSDQRKEAHEFYKRIGYDNVKAQQVFHLKL